MMDSSNPDKKGDLSSSDFDENEDSEEEEESESESEMNEPKKKVKTNSEFKELMGETTKTKVEGATNAKTSTK